jgi:hypothetical protein
MIQEDLFEILTSMTIEVIYLLDNFKNNFEIKIKWMTKTIKFVILDFFINKRICV